MEETRSQDEPLALLDAPEGIIYGPVASRRLGRSLGINLAPPGARVCKFSCVYCEFVGEPPRQRGARWPRPGDVGAALAAALARVGPLDSITISGHGEPTLHPRFPAVVAEILAARRLRPAAPVRILTSGSQAIHVEVRRALDFLDERIAMLDAAPERVNRPSARAASVEARIEGLRLLRDVTVQSCFFGGEESNLAPESVSEWIELVDALVPRGVQIHTINRPPGVATVRPARRPQLEEVARALRDRTGIEAGVFV